RWAPLPPPPRPTAAPRSSRPSPSRTRRAWSRSDRPSMILRDLALQLGCTLRGDGEVDVVRVAGIEDCGPGDITFLANRRYARRLASTRASAVFVSPET